VIGRGATRRDKQLPAEHSLLDWIPDGVVATDRDGRIVFANPQAERMTGYTERELLGHKIELLVPRRFAGGHERHRKRYHENGAGPRAMGRVGGDFRVRRKDGSEFSADIAIGPIETPNGPQTVALIRDISDRIRFEALLEHRALHDPLTDLANRSLFFDRLNQSLQGARREGKKVALVMLDLDGFKAVNDAFGHPVGDELLKQVAQRLQEGLRATDTAARIGGDEFALILPRVAGRSAAQVMVRKRLSRLQGNYAVRNQKIEIGASAGIALYPDDGRDTDTLMRNADAAMYSTKREGRGLVFHLPASRRRTPGKR
jgi:diguanylate cyclase (GGDEF)-like protein/PAS domain S-box-containing protein